MTDDYVMELHRSTVHTDEDDSSGNDPVYHTVAEADEDGYHLTAIEQPSQFVSYVATIVEDDAAPIPGGNTVLNMDRIRVRPMQMC